MQPSPRPEVPAELEPADIHCVLDDGPQVTPEALRVLSTFPAIPLCSVNTESGEAEDQGPHHTT